MAQVLKQEVKDIIVNSAKEEFLDKGYKNASMRKIAKKSNMTVGNLYRYFKNKSDINLFIVSDTLKEIDDLITSLTKNKLSMKSSEIVELPDINRIKDLLTLVSDNLVDIYSRHTIEFKILMLHSELNDDINIWFTNLIDIFISANFSSEFVKERKYLSRAYADSIFNGIKSIFSNSDIEISNMKKMVRTYLLSFFNMFTNDLERLFL